MRCRRILLVFICLHLIKTLVGQQVPAKLYSSQNGMFSDRITCMAQDSSGYLWFGTYFGLMRYDGYEFLKIQVPISMQNKFVHSLTTLNDTVYAGFKFDGGLLQWCRGKARVVDLPESQYNNINALAKDGNGKLIIAAQTSKSPVSIIWEYRNGKFKHLLTTDTVQGTVRHLLLDHRGNLWIGTDKNVITRNPDGRLETKLEGVIVNDLRQNENGTVVIATEKPRPFIHFFSTSNTSSVPASSFSSPDIVFPGLLGENRSGYWGVDRTGLVYLDENSKIKRYAVDLPPKVVVGPSFIDNEGSVWITTEAGAIKVSSLQAEIFKFDEWAPSSASILSLEGGEKLCTNGFSLFYFNNYFWSKVSNFSTDGLLGKLLQDSDGNIWISQWSGSEGIWKLKWKEGGIVSRRFFGRHNSSPIYSSDFKEAADGALWVVGGSKVSIFKQGEIVQYVDLSHIVPAQIINISLHKENKTIWIGTNGKGLYQLAYSIGSDGKYSFSLTNVLNDRNGLKDLFIRGNSLIDSKDNLWVGSRNAGLARITVTGKRILIKYFNETAGIAGSRISHLSEGKGCMWASTSDGIYKISGDAVVAKFSTGDGLLGNYVLHFIVDSNFVWAASAGGISKIALHAESTSGPKVTLSDFRILGISDSSLYNPSDRKIPFKKNSIGFTFTANSFVDETKIQYKYRLLGYNQTWSLPSSTNSVNYASLKPGQYVFQVIAQNVKGQWGEVPTDFAFEIVQPFYLRSWFLSLAAIAVIGIVMLARQLRIKQKLRLQNVRLQIARDLHDDVGSALGSINILTKTAQRRLVEQKDARVIVEKIGETTLKTLDSMDDLIWTINPNKEKVADLAVRMQNFAQVLLESLGIEFQFQYNAESTSKLSMMLRRELYLIFKETLYNAIRHSGCSHIEVVFYVGPKHLDLRIKDNGKGIQRGRINGNGLRNIEERAKQIHAKLIVDSADNWGTSVSVYIPSKFFYIL